MISEDFPRLAQGIVPRGLYSPACLEACAIFPALGSVWRPFFEVCSKLKLKAESDLVHKPSFLSKLLTTTFKKMSRNRNELENCRGLGRGIRSGATFEENKLWRKTADLHNISLEKRLYYIFALSRPSHLSAQKKPICFQGFCYSTKSC